METLEQRDWRRLIEALRRGNCILVTGPEISLEPDHPEQGVLSRILARKLAENYLASTPVLCDPQNIAHVAQLFCDGVNRTRMDLEFELEDFYRPYQDKTTPLHQDLAALPFKLCVNASPDVFLRNAFARTSKKPITDFYNFRRLRLSHLSEPEVQHPLVFDLYGSLSEPESLVLTENELLEFLVNVVTRDPPLQPLVSSYFANPDNSFLFLGFGFDQWHVRILLHILQVHGHKQPSLALESPQFFSDPAQRQTAVFFERECQFVFRQLSPTQFGAELRSRFEQQVGSIELGGEEAAAVPDSAPSVFLCYRSEDREKVIEVEQGLHALGIATWRDQQKLRGGDEWNRIINDVLRKQVDYVLVLQTRQMVDSVRTYCKREIEVALDTQKEFGDFKFVIPAKLEECDGFQNLAHLQMADLAAKDGIQRLGETILQDWEQRKARAQSLGGKMGSTA